MAEQESSEKMYGDDGPTIEDTNDLTAPMLDDESAFITPVDHYKATYMSFVLMGCGLLFPWNTVISAVDYFNMIYPDEGIEFLFSVAYMTTNLFGLIFVVLWGSKFSFRIRIVPGFCLFLVAVLILPFVENKAIALLLVGVLGITDAIVQGSLFALVGMFSPVYVSALMTGQGVAGTAVAVLRIISKLSFPDDNDGLKTSTYIYFALSGFTILLSIIAYILVLERSAVTRHYLAKSSEELKREKRLKTYPVDGQLENGDKDPTKPPFEYRPIIKMAVSVGSIFLVTLSLFPGITSELKSTNESLNKTGWFSVIMISIFDVGDLIGRTLPSWKRCIVLGENGVFIGSMARFIFFPLFILSFHPKLINYDIIAYVIMFAFAASNGYIATLAMMFATDKVSVHQKEATGALMVFILTTGLTSGVWVGFLLGKII